MTTTQNTVVTRNLLFIKKHLQGNKSTVIIDPHQATYFGEIGLTSSIDGPGLGEIFLKSDYDAFQYQLMSGVSDTVFVGDNKGQFYSDVDAKRLKQYEIIDTSNDGMVFLKRKT